LGVRLLGDLKQLFETAEAMHSADIVDALLKIEEGPWNECHRGKPITKNRLAQLLREFQIESSQVKIGHVNRWGYRREQFRDAFAAYLPHPGGFKRYQHYRPGNKGENPRKNTTSGNTTD
jgi:hypothetical protein